ncbi:SIS domain-containing protein, partial [Oceanobacter sp. 2_MG-2023]|uniref:SIS domain-containing protein n=1 Tax=Oceanobacter sp. 2_MG-2023 TaxID=3062619 RepID=UPI0027345CFF
ACGNRYHAGVTARYWIEALDGLSCKVEISSEFRYRQPVVRPNTLLVTISPIGDTADSLAAL